MNSRSVILGAVFPLLLGASTANPNTATASTTSSAPPACFWQQAGPTYVLRNIPLGLVLDVKDNRTGNGTPVQLWQKNGGRNQHWVALRCRAHDRMVLKSVSAQKCLDLSLRRPPGNGSPVYVYQCHYRENQQWRLVDDIALDPDFGKADSLASQQRADLVLHARQPSEVGSPVVAWQRKDASVYSVAWRLEPV